MRRAQIATAGFKLNLIQENGVPLVVQKSANGMSEAAALVLPLFRALPLIGARACRWQSELQFRFPGQAMIQKE